jgi:DNA-binding transcriptional ArsR family regulator
VAGRDGQNGGVTDVRPEALVGLLAEEHRLRVVAAVVLGASGEAEIVEATALDPRTVRHALERLIRGGLVEATAEGLRVAAELFKESAREAARQRPTTSPEALGATADQAEVLRNFLVDGRLSAIPAARGKRLRVLDFLAGQFEPGRVYPERDVNAILGRFHDDYALLRRNLVDEDFLERRDGFYWRTGGSVAVD